MMFIGMEHFGPILSGNIDLKPLTLFVGPNGCGKSHTATLLYAMSKLEHDYEHARFHFRNELSVIKEIKKETIELKKKYQNKKNMPIYTKILAKLANPETDLERILQNNFAINDILQKGQNHTSLHIKTRKHDIGIKFSADKLKVQGINPPSIKVLFDGQKVGHDVCDAEKSDDILPIYVPRPCNLFEIYDALVRRIIKNSDENYDAYYFPAERTGLLLAYRHIVDYSIDHSAKKRFNLNMPAVATDYLCFLNSLPTKQGIFAKITNDAEKTILHGKITTKNSNSGTEIYFEKSGNKFPLYMTASSVKNLAAFFLYLKFVAKKNDLVILEAPETNLHPKNQIELAKFIARLVNHGLYLVLTTHSPYFLEQLSHCIMAGQLPKTYSNVDKDSLSEDIMSADMVSVHKFEPVKKYYKITRINITKQGIPQDEFLSVDDELYAELSRLRQANR